MSTVQHEPGRVMDAAINITVRAFAAACVQKGWTTEHESGETEWALAHRLRTVISDFLTEMYTAPQSGTERVEMSGTIPQGVPAADRGRRKP